MIGMVLFGDGKLFIGHVHANHLALAADQLRQQVAVTP